MCRVLHAVTRRKLFFLTILCSATVGVAVGVTVSSYFWYQKLATELAREHYRTVLSDALEASRACQGTPGKMLESPGLGDYPPKPFSADPRHPEAPPSRVIP